MKQTFESLKKNLIAVLKLQIVRELFPEATSRIKNLNIFSRKKLLCALTEEQHFIFQ